MSILRWIVILFFLITPSSAWTIDNPNHTFQITNTNITFPTSQTFDSIELGADYIKLNGSTFQLIPENQINATINSYNTVADSYNVTFSGLGDVGLAQKAGYNSTKYTFYNPTAVAFTQQSNSAGWISRTITLSGTDTYRWLKQLSMIILTAVAPGGSYNSIATTETLNNGSWGASTLTGGADGSQWNSDVNPSITTAVDLWETLGNLIKTACIIIIIGGVIVAIKGNQSRNNIATMVGLGAVATGILTLIIIYSIIPIVGSYLDTSVTIPGATTSTGTLTFSGNVTDTELVNISTYTFEFDTDNTFTAGRAQVIIPAEGDGTADQAAAIANLTTAINNNASVAALVSAVNS